MKNQNLQESIIIYVYDLPAQEDQAASMEVMQLIQPDQLFHPQLAATSIKLN